MLNNNEEDKVVFKKRHTDFEGPIKNPIPHQEHLPALESQDPFKQKSWTQPIKPVFIKRFNAYSTHWRPED